MFTAISFIEILEFLNKYFYSHAPLVSRARETLIFFWVPPDPRGGPGGPGGPPGKDFSTFFQNFYMFLNDEI